MSDHYYDIPDLRHDMEPDLYSRRILSRRNYADPRNDRKFYDPRNEAESNESLDSAGKKKSFRRLLSRFAEKTSMVGVPYISNARFWWAKLIWSILLLIAVGAMSLHLWYLIDQFFRYPIQTKVSLGFASLDFPQITICNTNSMRMSKVDEYAGAYELKDLIEQMKPINIAPHQYDYYYDPYAYDYYYYYDDDDDDETTTAATTELPGTTDSPVRKKRFIKNYDKVNMTKYEEEEYVDYYWDLQEEMDYEDEFFVGEIDAQIKLLNLFTDLYMEVPKEDRAKLGHNISDMLISCSFNGRTCNQSMFRLHQTSEYGNCWTVASDKFKVASPGPSTGLQMVFYLETTEYLNGITDGYGMRLQVHEKNTYPFPADEGLYLSASMETSIGLKLVQLSRSGRPYGFCDDGSEFSRLHSVKYTRRACQESCKVTKVIERCNCFDKRVEEIARFRNDSLRPCRNKIELQCMLGVYQDSLKKDLCTCYNPCSEVSYVKSLSQRQWPTDEYALILLQKICQKYKKVCKSLREKLSVEEISLSKALHNNFLKVNIYFEDLNFQTIEEDAEIELQQFLSDVGGAIGLWIGLSILSLCEVVQLMLELCKFGCHKTAAESRLERRKSRQDLSRRNGDHRGFDSDRENWPHTDFGHGHEFNRDGYNKGPPSRPGSRYSNSNSGLQYGSRF